MKTIKLFTIGFKGKRAEMFFSMLNAADIKTLIDVRLHNQSQLAGYTKRDDLSFFLRKLCGCQYRHEPLLAPSKEIFQNYRDKKMTWDQYKVQFPALLEQRKAYNIISLTELDRACLLCSEIKPGQCHRRLVAEYLQKFFDNIEIFHL